MGKKLEILRDHSSQCSKKSYLTPKGQKVPVYIKQIITEQQKDKTSIKHPSYLCGLQEFECSSAGYGDVRFLYFENKKRPFRKKIRFI